MRTIHRATLAILLPALAGCLSLDKLSTDGVPFINIGTGGDRGKDSPSIGESTPSTGVRQVSPALTPRLTFSGIVSGRAINAKVGVFRVTGCLNFADRRYEAIWESSRRPALEAVAVVDKNGRFTIEVPDHGDSCLGVFLFAWDDTNADGRFQGYLPGHGLGEAVGFPAIYAFTRQGAVTSMESAGVGQGMEVTMDNCQFDF